MYLSADDTQIFDRFKMFPLHISKVIRICLIRSTVCIFVDQWFLCKRAAPGALKNCNGLSTTKKSNTLQKRGQRFSVIGRSWGDADCTGRWLKERQRDQGGTNKGRAFGCMGKKTRPLGRMMFQTPMEACFGGLWPLEVLWSCRRISQIAPLLLCHNHDDSPCAVWSHNWTFTENSRFPSVTHQLEEPSIQ